MRNKTNGHGWTDTIAHRGEEYGVFLKKSGKALSAADTRRRLSTKPQSDKESTTQIAFARL